MEHKSLYENSQSNASSSSSSSSQSNAPSLRVIVGSYQGKREYQEDRFAVSINDQSPFQFMSIFDGHGGFQASEYTCKHFHEFLLQKCMQVPVSEQSGRAWIAHVKAFFVEFDNQLLQKFHKENIRAGSTVSTMIYNTKLKSMTIAYLGDSRILWQQNNQVVSETVDHDYQNPEDAARARKRRLTGRHINYMQCKDQSALNVLRGFGDLHCKFINAKGEYTEGASAIPDVHVLLAPAQPMYFILASDGVWKAREKLGEAAPALPWKEFPHAMMFPEPMRTKFLEDHFYTPYYQKSRDNITSMIVQWNPQSS